LNLREYPIWISLIALLAAYGLASAASWNQKYNFRRGTWNLVYVFEFVRNMKPSAYDDLSESGGGGYDYFPAWVHKPLKLAKDSASPGLLGGSSGYVMSFARSCPDCADLLGQACGLPDAGLATGAYPRSGRYFFLTLRGPSGDEAESLLSYLEEGVRERGWSPACWDPDSACLHWHAPSKRLTLGWERRENRPPEGADYIACETVLSRRLH